VRDQGVDLLEPRVATHQGVEDAKQDAGEDRRRQRNEDDLADRRRIPRRFEPGFHLGLLRFAQLHPEGLEHLRLLLEHRLLSDFRGEEGEGRAGHERDSQRQHAEPARPGRHVGVRRPGRHEHAHDAGRQALAPGWRWLRRGRRGRGWVCHESPRYRRCTPAKCSRKQEIFIVSPPLSGAAGPAGRGRPPAGEAPQTPPA